MFIPRPVLALLMLTMLPGVASAQYVAEHFSRCGAEVEVMSENRWMGGSTPDSVGRGSGWPRKRGRGGIPLGREPSARETSERR